MRIPCRHVGRETTATTNFLDANGEAVPETWRFGRWDRAVWVELSAWAKTILPDPIAESLKNIDLAVAKDAEARRRLKLADHEEEERVKKLNRAEIARVEKANEKEKEEAQRDKRQAILIAPKLVPFIPMAPGYTDEHHQLVRWSLDKASSYLSFHSPEMQSLIASVPGQTQIFYLLLKKHHGDMTPELAYEILMELGAEEARRILETARGDVKPAKKKAEDPAA